MLPLMHTTRDRSGQQVLGSVFGDTVLVEEGEWKHRSFVSALAEWSCRTALAGCAVYHWTPRRRSCSRRYSTHSNKSRRRVSSHTPCQIAPPITVSGRLCLLSSTQSQSKSQTTCQHPLLRPTSWTSPARQSPSSSAQRAVLSICQAGSSLPSTGVESAEIARDDSGRKPIPERGRQFGGTPTWR